MRHSSDCETLVVAGTQLQIHRIGSGAPVLFLHGLDGIPASQHFFDELAKERTVLIPEHPGFGSSAMPKWMVGIGDLAYFYLDLIEQLGLPKIDVIGHSLGGWIAAELAIRNATNIRSLTLISPAGVRVKGVQSGDIFLWSAEERIQNLFHSPALVEQVLSTRNDPANIENQLRNSYASAKLAWQPRLYSPELQRWLRRIRIPVQLIWGEADKLLPRAYASAWTSAIADARLATIASCGHMPHVECPQETLSITRSFLNSVAA